LNDYVNKVTIIRKGEAAKKFNAVKLSTIISPWNLKIKAKLAIEEQSKSTTRNKRCPSRQNEIF
jgi:peptidylprolyl isomerase